MRKSLIDYTNDILKYIQEIPLSNNTVKYYHVCYNSLINYCNNSGKENLIQMAKEFLKYQENRYIHKEIEQIYYLLMRKAIYVLIDYIESGLINWKRRKYNQTMLCNKYTNILNEYEQSLSNSELAKGSVKLLVQMINTFLIFLETKHIYEIRNIQLCHVKEFIINQSPNHKSSIINLTWSMKKFFAFLNANGYSELKVESIMANPVPNRKKILPCFSKEELNSIFESTDTSTALGKRDYAIMKLSIETGFRVIDITNLCFSNINWIKNEITIVQQKTKNQLTVPLPIDTGNAIADYILNGRPKSELPYIFLTNRRPYQKLNRIVGANTIKRCLGKTDIKHIAGDGKTFHALRRTFGTNLVKAKVPITTVSQLLGHTTLDTSKRYISLNDDMLRFCCMDVSMYATTKEGLL